MPSQLFANNAASTMSGTLTQGGTTLVLATGTGDNFPAPTGGDFFLGTLYEKNVYSVEWRHEVVKVTARTADTLTIERDVESMTGQAGGYAYPSAGGQAVYFELRWTAAGAGNFAQKSANLADLSDAAIARTNLGISATNTPFTPNGSIAATSVQTAIQEVRDEAQPLDAELSAIAGLTSAADRLPYFTGSGTAALATFTAAGRALVDDASNTDQRTTLGLGDSATKNIGTIAGTVAAGDHNHSGVYEPAITTLANTKGGTGQNSSAWTGLVKTSSGTWSTAAAGTDYVAPGGALGTPSSGALTNCSGLPLTGVTSALSGIVKCNGASVFSAASAGTDYAKPDTASSWTAQQTFKELKDTVHTITDGAAFEIDPANGSIQTVTLGASRTPKATNFEAGQVVLLGIDDGAAYTITWTDATLNPTWVKAGGAASAPTLATSGYTWVLLWKVGSVMYAAEAGKP